VKDYNNQVLFLSDITLQKYSNQIISNVICCFQKTVEVNVILLCVSHFNSVFIVLLQTEPTSRDTQLRVKFTDDHLSHFTLAKEFSLAHL
jgi:hypothetical protein